jgi:MFS family permease
VAAFSPEALRVFRHRDFRFLWAGAFLSFCGSWVQNVAQGWLVFQLTGSEQKLALVNFFWALPVALFGIGAGTLTDSFHKKRVLVFCQLGLAANALFLAWAVHIQSIRYEQILLVSFLNGCIACIEMPTRQSMVSEVVPTEDLSSAIPLNAMTFNIARIIGPWFGAILLAKAGPQACYLFNGLSFSALILAVLAIRYSYPGRPVRENTLTDLVLEGARYTFQNPKLKRLFTMESIVSFFGLAYLPLLPAIAERQLGLDKVGLGHCYSAIGIGAMTSLALLTLTASATDKYKIVWGSMLLFGLSLSALGWVREPWFAYLLLFFLGLSTLAQFNVTNTLFQMLAPEKLRGRVLAMHIWALNGIGPFGLLLFGWLANQQTLADRVRLGIPSVSLSVAVQGGLVLFGWGLVRLRAWKTGEI